MKIDIGNYHKVMNRPDLSLWMTLDGSIYGCFVIGNDFSNDSNYYGAYPRSYLKRIYALFSINESDNVLHIFSGSLESNSMNEITMDINPELLCDVVGNAEEAHKYFDKDSFDIILADPPYTNEDAEKYMYKMPHKLSVTRSLYKIAKPGCILVWLDIRRPQYRKEEWKSIGYISLVRSTNHYIRTICLFERV